MTQELIIEPRKRAWTPAGVARLRRRLGVSQRELAILLNIDQAQVSRIESGGRTITGAISRVLDYVAADCDEGFAFKE